MELFNQAEDFAAAVDVVAVAEGEWVMVDDEETREALASAVTEYLSCRSILREASNSLLGVRRNGDIDEKISHLSRLAGIEILGVADDAHEDYFLAGTSEQWLNDLYREIHSRGDGVRYTHASGLIADDGEKIT